MDDILDLCANFIEHDPNYNYDDDDDNSNVANGSMETDGSAIICL
jgi:hypothetical protein